MKYITIVNSIAIVIMAITFIIAKLCEWQVIKKTPVKKYRWRTLFGIEVETEYEVVERNRKTGVERTRCVIE